MKTGSLTTARAAEQLGVTTSRIIQMIRDGMLPAIKDGRDYFIQPADVKRAMNRPGRGRPKLPKKIAK